MKTTLKIPLIFAILLIIGSCMIYFGSKNDAVSVAKNLKSGVLTADEINIAFENVGGKLIKHHVQESDKVKKGDILLVLDDADTNITLMKTKAMVDAQNALIRQESAAIDIDENETDLLEITTWRKIEEIQAMLDSAMATEKLAKSDFERNYKLSLTGSVSQSTFDNINNALITAKMNVVQISNQLASTTIGATKSQLDNLKNNKTAHGMMLNSIINSRDKIKNRQNQLALLKAQLAQYQAELAQLELNQQRLTLLAPESGKILKVLYEEGEIIPIGAPAIILETDRRYVDIYIGENQILNYQPNSNVIATVPALAKQITGVIRFANVAPSFSDLRMSREHGQADLTSYQVRVYMENEPNLLTGMTVEVDDEQYR